MTSPVTKEADHSAHPDPAYEEPGELERRIVPQREDEGPDNPDATLSDQREADGDIGRARRSSREDVSGPTAITLPPRLEACRTRAPLDARRTSQHGCAEQNGDSAKVSE